MSRLVVKTHNPVRVALRVVASTVVLGLAGWGVFEYGAYTAGYDFHSANTVAAKLEKENSALKDQVEGLREENAILQRSRDVEREAGRELNNTVLGLQDQIAEMKSELAFYRGIVTPKETAGGLRVQRFDVSPNGVKRGYRYKLVLTQVLKNDNVVKGNATVVLEGTRHGKLATVSLGDLGIGGKDGKLDFRFRYFQNFEGNFVLPDGFIPARATVTVMPRGRGHRDVEQVFDWPAEEN
jgi:hypothetical protein